MSSMCAFHLSSIYSSVAIFNLLHGRSAFRSQTSKCCKWLTYFIGGRLPLQIIQVLWLVTNLLGSHFPKSLQTTINPHVG